MKIWNLLVYICGLYLQSEGRLVTKFSEEAEQSHDVNRIRRITSGREAEKHAYPWMVSLQLELYGESKHFCGGALIGKEWVLTAAHCMYGTPTDFMVVVLGDHDLGKDEGTEQRLVPAAIYVDDDFNGNTCVGDVALIQLEAPGAELNDYVQPIKLATKQKQSGKCVAAGWGASIVDGETSNILEDATLDVIRNNVCKTVWVQQVISGSMMCAGSGESGICSGDSGGPLFCRENGEWVDYGISSWGPQECGIDGVPDGYTRVSSYYDDIMGVINEYSVLDDRDNERKSIDKKKGRKRKSLKSITE